MQRHGCFPAAGYALDNQRRIFRRTDNLVLLGLNRRNNVAQAVVLVLAEAINKKLIRYSRAIAVAVIRIHDPVQNPFTDHDVPLQIDQAFDQALRRHIRGIIPAGKRVEQAGHRRAPVDDDGVFSVLVANANLADIKRRFSSSLLLEIQPPKIRFMDRLLQLFTLALPILFKKLFGKVLPGVHRNRTQSLKLLVDLFQGAVKPRLLFLIGTLKIIHFSYLLRFLCTPDSKGVSLYHYLHPKGEFSQKERRGSS
ncbi:hypothetical protein D3C74_256430 [compost metagenome]